MTSETQIYAIGIRANRPNAIRYTLYAIRCTKYAKQTQYLKSQMNVTPYNTTDYGNISNWTLGENKPNQSMS